jgi:hypothetical protein
MSFFSGGGSMKSCFLLFGILSHQILGIVGSQIKTKKIFFERTYLLT